MIINLKKKLKNHLLITVGKVPTKKEMKKVDEEIKPLFAKIYKNWKSIGRYNGKLANLWIKVVANETLAQEVKLLLENTKIRKDSQITSLASGLAVYELFLAREIIPNGEIYCLDNSKYMNKIAKDLAYKLKAKNIKIITTSVTKVPIKTNTQDVVLARRTGLSNDKRWIKVLKESNRIMKKNKYSRFVYTVDKVFNKKIKEIRSDLNKADFEFVTMKTFGRNYKLKVCMIIAKPYTKLTYPNKGNIKK